MEIELSAIAALFGNVEFSTVTPDPPDALCRPDASRHAGRQLPSSGRIGRSIAIARGVVAEDRLAPDTARLPDDTFGTCEFSDGRIVGRDGGSEAELVTDLAGRLEWEQLNGRASLAATGVWRGEAFDVEPPRRASRC